MHTTSRTKFKIPVCDAAIRDRLKKVPMVNSGGSALKICLPFFLCGYLFTLRLGIYAVNMGDYIVGEMT